MHRLGGVERLEEFVPFLPRSVGRLGGVPVCDLDGSLAQFVHDGIREGIHWDDRLVDPRAAQVGVHMRRTDFDDLDPVRLQQVPQRECV
jgi:hypothetical protein